MKNEAQFIWSMKWAILYSGTLELYSYRCSWIQRLFLWKVFQGKHKETWYWNIDPIKTINSESYSDNVIVIQAMGEERFRLVVLGSSRAGKTSIIHRYLHKEFSGRYKETVEEMYSRQFRIRVSSHFINFVLLFIPFSNIKEARGRARVGTSAFRGFEEHQRSSQR